MIVAAGFGAGAINAVVGSGSLITFPTLLAFGYPPLVANVSNTVGLVPGSLAGAWGYRRELTDQTHRAWRLGVAAVVGALFGACLLLVLPARAFETIVPVLVGAAVLLVAAQPWLSARLAALAARWPRTRPAHLPGPVVIVLVAGTAVYGGYFGAAQGVLLIAVLTIGLQESLQRANGLKNLLAGLVNLTAGLVFACVASVDWAAAGAVAVGATAGGLVGGGLARRLPAWVLRACVVTVGLVALVALLG